MVWTEIPLYGRTDMCVCVFAISGITAARHGSDLLEPIFRPLAGAIGDAFMFMQYNASAHTARMCLTLFDDEGVNVMN